MASSGTSLIFNIRAMILGYLETNRQVSMLEPETAAAKDTHFPSHRNVRNPPSSTNFPTAKNRSSSNHHRRCKLPRGYSGNDAERAFM